MRDHDEDRAEGLIEASSNRRAAADDFPELPLGSNAFLSPLHTVSIPPPSVERPSRPRAVVVGFATLASVTALLALAVVQRDDGEQVPGESLEVSMEREPPTAVKPIVKTAAAVAPSLPSLKLARASQTPAVPSRSPSMASADKDSERAVAKRAPSKRERARRTTVRRKREKTAAVAVEAPSRATVLAAMRSVTTEARTCLHGNTAVAQVDITFSGKTGTVSAAKVRGVSGQAASCVERAVRRAKVPSFAKPQLQITFPFRPGR